MFEEKLITIAENIDKVYKAGQGTEGGGSGAQTDLWDLLQENGARADYYYGFAGRLWNDTTFCPKYSLSPTIVNYMFMHSQITDLVSALEQAGVTLDFSRVTGNSYCTRPFDYTSITHIGIVDLSNAKDTFNTFFGRSSTNSPLITIDLLKLSPNGTNLFGANFFQNQDHLENLTIEGVIGNNFPTGACPFSSASIDSIIEHLKDLTGSTAKTWTVSATTYAKMTDAQKQAVSAKNWNLASA